MGTERNALNTTLRYVCEPFGKMMSGGLIFGRDPSKSSLPLFVMQVGLANSITAILKPFVPFTFVPEMLSGIILGPSVLSQNGKFRDKLMAPERGFLTLRAFEHLALMFQFFLLTVQIDLIDVFKKAGRLTFSIGMASFLLPMAINLTIAWFLKGFMPNQDLRQSLSAIAMLQTTTTVRTIVFLLEDLKLVHSELGRTAMTSSLISGTCAIFLGIVASESGYNPRGTAKQASLCNLSRILMVIIVVFVFRPIMLWMMRQTPEKKSLKEKYICIIILMILGCSLFGELTGLHPYIGPLVLGMATPNSPPMGSSLFDKLGSFVWIVLMPCFAISVGKYVNIFDMGFDNFLVVNFFAVLATFGRLVGTILPPLYYKMPLKEALPLGLILSCRGSFDLVYAYGAKQSKVISNQTFGLIILTTVFHSAIVSPIFKAIYDTSRRYLVYDRRTIQHAKQYSEFPVVACIHEPENASSLINILDIASPTNESPLTVYVLNLEELFGRLVPLFISHKYDTAPSAQPTRASRIINIFNQFEEIKQGLVKVQCFTSVASYASMHDNICSLANEQNTTLIIIPFQKFDGRPIRAVNKNVLEHAPCSVAIFFARGMLAEPRVLNVQCIIGVCVIFIGGSDDREALAFGARMVNHPFVRLTIVQFVDEKKDSADMVDKIYDAQAIENFKLNTCTSKNVVYKETSLTEVSALVRVLHCMESEFDLIMVGRRHNETALSRELSAWAEFIELGVIGDLFVSSDDCRASVLVIQQQSLVVEEMLEPPKLQ